MQIREIITLIESATASDITTAYITKAYELVDADPSLVDISLSLDNDRIHGFTDLDNMVEIGDIEVPEDNRLEGLGTKTMNILCELADTMGITLVLRTWASDEMDLDSWYSRFGFEGMRTMFRRPKSN